MSGPFESPSGRGAWSSSATRPLRAADDQIAPRARKVSSVKLVVAGGFGVGKTTFVSAVSEIPPSLRSADLWNTSGRRGGVLLSEVALADEIGGRCTPALR